MNNTSQIPQLMERLIQVMKEKRLSTPYYLDAGIQRQEVLNLTKSVVDLPEDVIAFYEFTNGTSIAPNQLLGGDNAIMYGYTILPLQLALRMREETITQTVVGNHEWLDESGEDVSGWLPIFGWGWWCHLIDVNRASRDEPCIFSISHGSDPTISYVSLESMLRSIIACYEQNAYIVKDKKIVDYDLDKIRQIERLYNPGIEE